MYYTGDWSVSELLVSLYGSELANDDDDELLWAIFLLSLFNRLTDCMQYEIKWISGNNKWLISIFCVYEP